MIKLQVVESRLARGQGIGGINYNMAKEVLGGNDYLLSAFKNNRFNRQIYTSASGVGFTMSLGMTCVPNKALIKLYGYMLECYTGEGKDILALKINQSPEGDQIGIELIFEHSSRCCIVVNESNRVTYKERAEVKDISKLVTLLYDAISEATELIPEIVPIYSVNCWFTNYGSTSGNIFGDMYEGMWSLGFYHSSGRDEFAMNYIVG